MLDHPRSLVLLKTLHVPEAGLAVAVAAAMQGLQRMCLMLWQRNPTR